MISAAGDRAVESSTSDDDLLALILDSSEEDFVHYNYALDSLYKHDVLESVAVPVRAGRTVAL